MYKEFKKYKTGRKIPTPAIRVGRPDLGIKSENIIIELDEYCFKFGEILNDFIEFKKKKYWKIFFDGHSSYKFTLKTYIEILNLWGQVNYSL